VAWALLVVTDVEVRTAGAGLGIEDFVIRLAVAIARDPDLPRATEQPAKECKEPPNHPWMMTAVPSAG